MKLWIALCVCVLLSPVFAFWVARFFYVSEPHDMNSGASFPPRTGPAASKPHTARGGNVLNSNFHAAIPNQKGQQDNA